MKIIYGKESKIIGNVKYVNESDLKIPIGIEGYEDTISFLRNLAKKKINEKLFPTHFAYKNFSLWWFIYPTILPSIQRRINFIKYFNKFLDLNKISSIQIKDDFDNFELIYQICKNKKIHLSYSKLKHLSYCINKKIIHKLKQIKYEKVFSKKFSKRISIFNNKKKEIPDLSNKIIFAASTAYRRTIYDSNLKKSIRGEFLIGQIGNILKKMELEIVGIDLDYTYFGDFDILEERINDQSHWFPIEKILQNFSNIKTIHNYLKSYYKLINNDNFHSCFNYMNVQFWNQIEFDFQKLKFTPYFPMYINLIESLDNFFQKNKPKAIFLPYETGPIALALIVTAAKHNIRTVGIQHGIIPKYTTDYSHEIFRNQNNHFGMPLPDLILLFGNFTKDLLINEGYPEEKLFVFGHPDYFNVDNFLNNINKKSILEKYNIPENKKIILFATGKSQRYYTSLGGRFDYDEQVLKYILNHYSNNKDYFIIIKPHPGEYLEYYKNEIQKSKSKNVVILQGNLFELLSISDVVLAVISNVLLDSIALKKITIRIDFPDNNVWTPYDKYQVLISCDIDSLMDSINDAIHDESLKKKLLANREVFLKEMYGIPNENYTNQIKLILEIN